MYWTPFNSLKTLVSGVTHFYWRTNWRSGELQVTITTLLRKAVMSVSLRNRLGLDSAQHSCVSPLQSQNVLVYCNYVFSNYLFFTHHMSVFLFKSTSFQLGTAWDIIKISIHHRGFTSSSYCIYQLSASERTKLTPLSN